MTKTRDSEGAGAAVGRDDASRRNPLDRLHPAAAGRLLRRLDQMRGQTRGADHPDFPPVQPVGLDIRLHQPGDQDFHPAPQLPGGLEPPLQNLNQRMDAQQAAAHGGGIADPAPRPQKFQLPGDEAHPRPPGQALGGLRRLGQLPFGMGFQQPGRLHHHRALPNGHLPGIHRGDGFPAFGGNPGALIGTGGDGRIGQMKDFRPGIAGADGIKGPFKVLRGAPAGFGQDAGNILNDGDCIFTVC